VAEGYDVGPGERLKAGDKVVVMEGPLKDLEGIFEREVKHTERVMLLLTAISYQSCVQVPREFVEKVGACV
jgi:transcription antitermination factor NusG